MKGYGNMTKETKFHITRPKDSYRRESFYAGRRRLEDYCGPPTEPDADFDELKDWIEGIGPIMTPTIISLQRDIIRLMRDNGRAINGGWKWMAIDGYSKMGKTYSVIVAALLIADALVVDQPDDVVAPYHHITVVFIGAPTAATVHARYLLDKIAIFCGFVLPTRGGLPQLIAKVREMLERFGTLLIVVDDGHFIKRMNGGRDLTDDLKSILTEIPVTWVFVGAGLRESALLHVPSEKSPEFRGTATPSKRTPARYMAVEQLKLRMKWRPMVPERVPDDGAPPPQFSYFVTTYVSQLERIPRLRLGSLRTTGVLTELFRQSAGRPGIATDLLNEIAFEALRQPHSDVGAIAKRTLAAAHEVR